MKLADLEVGQVYYAEPRNSEWVNRGAYDIDNKTGRHKVELLDKTPHYLRIGYTPAGQNPFAPGTKNTPGNYVKVRFFASTDPYTPLAHRSDYEGFVTYASLRGIWDDVVAERQEAEIRWAKEAEDHLDWVRTERERRLAIETRAAARGLKGLRADESGTCTIREEDLVKFLDATEPTDWAVTAQDLMSGDPERVAKHLPEYLHVRPPAPHPEAG